MQTSDESSKNGLDSPPRCAYHSAVSCPDDDALLRHVRGTTAAADWQLVTEHLAGCTACRLAVSVLATTSVVPERAAESMPGPSKTPAAGSRGLC